MAITAKEWELLSFFEVEPTLTDHNIPWAYNSAAYRTTIGRLDILFSIQPAYSDFTLEVRDGERMLFEMTALGVKDVRYHKGASGESLELLIGEKQHVLLKLRPAFTISQHVG